MTRAHEYKERREWLAIRRAARGEARASEVSLREVAERSRREAATTDRVKVASGTERAGEARANEASLREVAERSRREAATTDR